MMNFIHNKTGNEYTYSGVGKMKANGQWVDCIFYTAKGHTYCREITDFFLHFTVIQPKNEDNIQQSNPV